MGLGRGKIGHLKDCTSGATAIEFALVSMPFILLLVGILETGLFFTAATLLEGSSQDAARLVRTGQAQNSGDARQMFERKLCDGVGGFLACDRLMFEAIRLPSDRFAEAESLPPRFDEDGNLEVQGFDAGDSNDVILIRVSYRYPFITPLIGRLMDRGGGLPDALLLSTVVIRNEPYRFGED